MKRSLLLVGLGCIFVSPALAQQSCSDRYPDFEGQQKFDYERCERAQADSRVGKYLCTIDHVAGIEYPVGPRFVPDLDQKPYVGSVKPKAQQFYIEIRQTASSKACDISTKPCDPDNNRYSLIAGHEFIIPSGLAKPDFVFTLKAGSFFLLENRFKATQQLFNSHVTDGRCEKII